MSQHPDIDVSAEFLTLHELVKAAKAKLKPNEWDYLMGGSESETTLKRNRLSIDSLALRPRVLRRVTSVDVGSVLFGRKLRIPALLAPIGSLDSFERGGGATAAKAASAFGIPLMLSSQCNPGLEACAEAAGEGLRIFQLYVRGDSSFEDDMVRRATAAGYFAFCVTVDSAHYARRERDIAKRFAKPWRAGATGLHHQAEYTWDNVKRFKDKHTVPLILKGIATGEDAAEAVELGVDGIYVSNHGGRQLDHGRGALDVLPQVVEAVGGKARILIDGGFMRGTDIVKALALGADAVSIGRLFGLAMSAAGQDGIVRMLELIEEEIGIAFRLMGVRNRSELSKAHVCPAPSVTLPHALSAFPLLEEGY